MLCENKKQKPIVLYDGAGENDNTAEDMLANFQLMSIYRSHGNG